MRYADGKYRLKQHSVYVHKCPNGKVYVGLTSQNPESRWNCGKGYKYQKLFYRAIQKYGWDNIEHIIIKSGLTLAEASKLEKELIAQYKSNNPNYGYNLTAGGEGISGYHLTPEQLERHRQNSIGRKHSQATKDKISKLKKGRKLNLTDAQRQACAERARKLGQASKGRKCTDSQVEERRLRMQAMWDSGTFKGHNTPHTDEAKLRIGKASHERVRTESEKQKLSIAAKNDWAKRKQPKNTKTLF